MPSSASRDPIDLTVRSLLVPALEATSKRLESLFESQMALMNQLDILDEQLSRYHETTEPLELQHTITKINQTKKRLAVIVDILAVVEKRLEKVRSRVH
jgi:hypothetical protein